MVYMGNVCMNINSEKLKTILNVPELLKTELQPATDVTVPVSNDLGTLQKL